MSNVHAGFLASICADPDDDVPRLIYADWLEDHGDIDRAEFIRVQCEMARLEAEDSASQALYESLQEAAHIDLDDKVSWKPIDPGVARRRELHRRVRALVKQHGETWKADLPKRCGISWTWDSHRPWASWSRGFHERATLKSATLLRRSTNTLQQVPLRFLALPDNPRAIQARKLLGSGLLGRVTGFRFEYGAADLLRALGAHTDAARVTSLSSSQARSDVDAVVRAITRSPNWSGLRTFSLRGSNDASAVATQELLQASHLQGLTSLRLNADQWTTDTVRALATAGFSQLQTLELYGCPLNNQAALALANSPSLHRLRTLELGSSGITGSGLSALIASSQLANLTALKLDWCRSRSWKLDEKLLASARGSSLRRLHVSLMHMASLTASAVEALAGCPALGDLLVLELPTNRLNDDAIQALVANARFTHLGVLYLSHNRFGDRGVTALAQWPGLASVRSLNLCGNNVGEQGALALVKSPHLGEVQVLHLSGGKMSQAALQALHDRFGDALLVS